MAQTRSGNGRMADLVWRGLLLSALLVLLPGCEQRAPGYPLLEGSSVYFEALRGNPVFINYWAEWCTPCREEIQAFNEFSERHPSVAVLSVNFDGVRGDTLAAQVAALGIKFPTLLQDPRRALGVKPATALPETLVLDRAGRVYTVLQGPQTQTTLAATLGELLEATR